MRRLVSLWLTFCLCVVSCDLSLPSRELQPYVGFWATAINMDDVFQYAALFNNGFFFIDVSRISDGAGNQIDFLFGRYAARDDHALFSLFGYSDSNAEIHYLDGSIDLPLRDIRRYRRQMSIDRYDQTRAVWAALSDQFQLPGSFFVDLGVHLVGLANFPRDDYGMMEVFQQIQAYERYGQIEFYLIDASFDTLIADPIAVHDILYRRGYTDAFIDLQ